MIRNYLRINGLSFHLLTMNLNWWCVSQQVKGASTATHLWVLRIVLGWKALGWHGVGSRRGGPWSRSLHSVHRHTRLLVGFRGEGKVSQVQVEFSHIVPGGGKGLGSGLRPPLCSCRGGLKATKVRGSTGRLGKRSVTTARLNFISLFRSKGSYSSLPPWY